MSAFKKAGVVVTTPSSGTYVIEAIGNVGLLADLLNAVSYTHLTLPTICSV